MPVSNRSVSQIERSIGKKKETRKKEKIPEKHESGERKKRRTKEWEVRK